MLRRSIVFFFAIVLLCASCTPPPAVITEPGRQAYTADQVLQRIESLQAATITAFQAGEIDRETSRAIITVTIEMAKLADAASTGWRNFVITAWRRARERIPALSQSPLSAYAAALDAMFQLLIAEGTQRHELTP
jgi:hypothetical protein